MLKYNTDKTVGTECSVDMLCMETPCARRCCCVLVPQPTDTTAPQRATVLCTDPHDFISILTRHFSVMHFNIILQCMQISSKLHITLRCSGQNVRDFQFRNACYITHPSLLSHIFTSRSSASAWKLQIHKHLSFNFVNLSFPCLFFHIRSSAAALRATIIPHPPAAVHVSQQHKAAAREITNERWHCSEMHKAVHSAVLTTCCYTVATEIHTTAIRRQYGDCLFPNTQKCWVGSQSALNAECSVMLLNPL